MPFAVASSIRSFLFNSYRLIMAEGKKSFIAYSDWHGMFKALPDDIAGQLIKYVFSYVNDENPEPHENFVINALFEQVKATLKRDLNKWEKQRDQRSKAGKKSAEKRKATKINERSTSVNEKQRNSTVSDSVSVSVNVNDKKDNKYTMYEIEISNVEEKNKPYFEVAKMFFDLIRSNIIENGGNTKNIDNQKAKNWLDTFRLMNDSDKYTIEQLRSVYKVLQTDNFWKGNILSPQKLREKFNQLILKANSHGKGFKKDTTSIREAYPNL